MQIAYIVIVYLDSFTKWSTEDANRSEGTLGKKRSL